MENLINNYFLNITEPTQSAFLYLRHFFITEMGLTEHWKYNIPFYYFNGKWFCYLSYNKKKNKTHIGFVKGNKIKHENLLSEGRTLIKIFKINPNDTIDINAIKTIIAMQKAVY